jgi:signal transduction histidine kinase
MTEEALRNIERHARATRVSVTISCADAAHMQLQITDDGVGFDTSLDRPGHFGLIGLREQAQLIGAELQIESTPDRGTTLRLSLRIAPESL